MISETNEALMFVNSCKVKIEWIPPENVKQRFVEGGEEEKGVKTILDMLRQQLEYFLFLSEKDAMDWVKLQFKLTMKMVADYLESGGINKKEIEALFAGAEKAMELINEKHRE
ncbi:MAG: hypothetical protein WC940_03410 [Candidatus Paceibacterota bacterium]|jgi:hypothetical protein